MPYVPGDDDCIDESLELWSSNTPASLCSHFCLNGNGKKLLVSEYLSLMKLHCSKVFSLCSAIQRFYGSNFGGTATFWGPRLAVCVCVVTETRNQPKPAKTSQNHPKRPKTTQNQLQNQPNQPKRVKTSYNIP